jgi:hypothetical protein
MLLCFAAAAEGKVDEKLSKGIAETLSNQVLARPEGGMPPLQRFSVRPRASGVTD